MKLNLGHTLLFVCAGACTTTPISPPSPASPTTSATSSGLPRPRIEVTSPTLPAWYGDPAHGRSGQNGLSKLAATGPFFSDPPVFQKSWLQPAWFIDPINATGCASDTNATCSTSTCSTLGDGPCLTYAQIAARWGTYAPRLKQNTTVTFLSSQPNAFDPITLVAAHVDLGAQVTFTCALPTPNASGTLSNVVAKNRSAQQLLQATLTGAMSNQLVINTTHPSHAFIYTNAGGSNFNISQPINQSTLTENNSWANGDAWASYTPLTVYFDAIDPILSSNVSLPVIVSQCTLGGPPSTNSYFSLVWLQDIDASATNVILDITNGDIFLSSNRFAYVGSLVGEPEGRTPLLIGGIIGAGGNPSQFGSVQPELDLIVTAGSMLHVRQAHVEDIFLDTGSTLNVIGNSSIGAGGGHVYGPGTLNGVGVSRITYPSGVGAAVATFLQTGFTLNSVMTACSHSGAAPDVVDCGISLTPSHLDAAQGTAGFGGLAYNLGGGAITNGSP